MSTGKFLLDAFKRKVETTSGEYHKSWARKFGNKAQQAKSFFKRDKAIVGSEIATHVIKSAVSNIPIPGTQEGAAALEAIGGAALEASISAITDESTSELGGYFLNRKISMLQKSLDEAKLQLGQLDSGTENALKSAKKMQLKTELKELERKKVKYDLVKLPNHGEKLQGRMFKLKEATRKAQHKLKATQGQSHTDTPIDIMGRWSEYFTALYEVEHYQKKCRESLDSINLITIEAEAYMCSSEASTLALRAKHEPSLERSFGNVIRDYPEVTSLEKLEDVLVRLSLQESGLA